MLCLWRYSLAYGVVILNYLNTILGSDKEQELHIYLYLYFNWNYNFFPYVHVLK